MSFPRYESYKDSGVEWLGEVPVNWDIKPLKYLVSNTNAGEVIDRSYWGGSAEVLYTCAIEPLDCDYQGFPDWKRTSEKDLLLTRNGTPYVHKPIVGAIYTNVVQRVTLHSGLNRNFIAIGLHNSANNLRGYGVSIESLNYELWKELPVVIPSASEQSSITRFLDRETAKIDALIVEQEKLIELLKEKRRLVISNSVTKGLNPSAILKDSGNQWLGDVPSHWSKCKIKRLFCQLKRQGYPHLPVLSVYREYGVIKKDSRDDNNNKTPENLDNYQLVNHGDLVINKMKAWQGSLGISSYEGITSPDYIVYASNHHQSDSFLHYMLRQQNLVDTYKAISNGIRPQQWRIEPNQFENLTFFLPPKDEQEEIVSFISAELTKLDALSTEVQYGISLLRERRTALISAAVTGKIDVRGLVSTALPEEAAA